MTGKWKPKTLKGLIHGGFKGECNNRNPWYIITEAGEDGIFICDILKKYFGKKVKITIEILREKESRY